MKQHALSRYCENSVLFFSNELFIPVNRLLLSLLYREGIELHYQVF